MTDTPSCSGCMAIVAETPVETIMSNHEEYPPWSCEECHLRKAVMKMADLVKDRFTGTIKYQLRQGVVSPQISLYKREDL